MWYPTQAELEAIVGLPDGTPVGALDTGFTGTYYAGQGIVPDLRSATGLSLLMYGDGSDGDVTISSNTDLDRDYFYANLTVEAGANLNTFGFRLWVRGTLTNRGVISNNGDQLNPSGLLAGGQSGGAGVVGVAAGNDGNQFGSHGFGGAAGDGGGTTGPAAGAGGVSNHDPILGGIRALPMLTTGLMADGGGAGGGGGGGSGASNDAAATSGQGGHGGGVVLIACQILDNTLGVIEASGERGEDASGAGEAGGGGGGGGGLLIVVADEIFQGTIQVLGGEGGFGIDDGAGGLRGDDGASGNPGTLLVISNR